MAQQTFFDLGRASFGSTRTEKLLEKLDQVVPWKEMERRILEQRDRTYGGVGRPMTNVIKLLKCLFLQGMYHLSDPEIEDQLRDRMSFQKFVGVSEVKDIPDETTICYFRNELVGIGFQESIFTITQCMLAEMGITVKEGHIQDGTIIESSKGKKNKKGENTRDSDATFTKKNGETYCGFKGHIETETKDSFIMNATFTTASVHDSQQQDALMLGEETESYGDSAYGMSKGKNEYYEAHGLKVKVHEKGVRGKPLTQLQKETNRIKSTIRAKVEHPFAWIKGRYMHTKVRYRGMIKNGMHWFFLCAVYNFERLARQYA